MKTNSQLDDVMRRWVSLRTPSEATTTESRAQLRRRLEAERFLDLPDAPPAPHRRAWTFAMAGVAAGLFLALASLNFHRMSAGSGLRLRPLTASELQARSTVYRAVLDLFGSQLDRLDMTSAGMNIVLVENARDAVAGTDSDARPLIVRVVAMERASDGSWHTAWKREVIAHDQDVIPLRVENGGTSDIVMWTCPMQDGKFYVDFKLDVTGSSPFSGDTAAVVQPGRPHELMMFRSAGGEYRIFQTIDRLPSSGTGNARTT
jgi:hypothetical protein